MQAELDALGKALEAPTKPVIAIIGGAKVSTKIDLLENLVSKVDALVIGGGMANTFLHAQGIAVGKSLAEKDLAATALRIMEKAEAANCAHHPPCRRRGRQPVRANAPSHAYGLDAIPADGMILDVGPQSIVRFRAAIDDAATLGSGTAAWGLRVTPFDRGTMVAAGTPPSGPKPRNDLGRRRRRYRRGPQPAGGGRRFSYFDRRRRVFLEWMEGSPCRGGVLKIARFSDIRRPNAPTRDCNRWLGSVTSIADHGRDTTTGVPAFNIK